MDSKQDKVPTYDTELAARLRARRERDGGDKAFYDSRAWRDHLRVKVMADHHWECQDCLAKSPARYTRAEHVHHVMHVDQYPGWAMSEWACDSRGNVIRNLVPLCHECHDRRHDRYMGVGGRAREPLTPERW